MVGRGWLALGLMWMGLPLAALAGDLPLTLDHARIERGRWAVAEIRAPADAPPLADLDLAPWETAFHIERLDGQTASGQAQRLRLRLHPRRTGSLILPPLHFHGRQTSPARLEVVADHPRGDPVVLTHTISATTAWERQQIRLMVTVITPDEFASLRSGELRLPDFAVTPLPARREPLTQDGQRRFRLQLGWALYPLHPGQPRLELPPVEYRLGGGTERRWYLPRVKLAVRPLPAWLPPTIPVGTVTLDSRVEPDWPWLRTGRLATWEIVLRSPDMPPAWLPPVLRQIRSSADLRVFPATTRRSLTPDQAGVHGQVIHRLPFKPLTDGPVALPTLRLRWFDPRDGRLHTREYSPARPWALRLPLQLLLLALVLLLARPPLRRLIARLQRFRRRRLLLREANTAIARAESPLALREALRLHAEAMGWPRNLTLREWCRRWQAGHAVGPDFAARLQRLSDACYRSASAIDLAALRTGLRADLRAPRRRSGWLGTGGGLRGKAVTPL